MIPEDFDLPPHSLQAEQSVLGAMFLDNAAAAKINGALLAPEDFYTEGHRLIFDHAMARIREGEPADVALVAASLDAAGKLDDVGGMPYLGSLVANVPTAANIVHYAAVVHERAELRRIAAAASDLRRAAMNPGGRSAAEIVAESTAILRPSLPSAWAAPEPIGEEEFETARPTPDCVVEDYLFADVAIINAPGTTGKTTLLLYEAVHIVLARPLYGRRVAKSGPVLILTAEDSREILVARLRLICTALELSAADTARVRANVRIKDVVGAGFKLTRVVDDVVVPAPAVDAVIEWGRAIRPVLVSLDPAVSFGIGESRVNDAEQGLIEAARRIRTALNCCVRYVHHSGKGNARDKALDQYAGRGGSAFADGARMVAILQPLTPDEWRSAAGMPFLAGETGMVLAIPKLSYGPPAPDVLICRKGYAFTHLIRSESNPAGNLQANCDQVLRAIVNDLERGIRHSKNSLEALGLMPRADLRGAISTLIARNVIEQADIPDRRKGGAQTYLRPIGSPTSSGEALSDSP
jgi:RecA-family ATPase